MKYLIFIIFGFTLLLSACGDKYSNCDQVTGSYEFVMHFTLSPAQEVYHIGDTITISSFVNNPIFERKTGNYYTLENFKFYLVSSLDYMDTLINDYSNFNRFEVLFDSVYNQNIFTYSDGTNSILGQYNYQNNQYSYEFKLVAKETGSYLFTQGSDINYVGKDQYFEGKCSKTDIDAKFYMNGRADNNSHLLDEAPNSNFKLYLDHIEEQYFDNGGYCFKVID